MRTHSTPSRLLSNALCVGASLVFAAGLVASAWGQTQTPANPSNPGRTGTADNTSLARGDRMFLEKAAESGMKEVAVSEIVMSKLTTPAVKDFAQMMVKEHGEANQELKALASRKGVTLPMLDADLPRDWSKKMEDVEKDYLKEMVSDHKDAVKLFEDGTKSHDTEVAAFATKLLPKLRQHLSLVEGLEKAHKR